MPEQPRSRFLLPGISLAAALLIAGVGVGMWLAATRRAPLPQPRTPAHPSLETFAAVPDFTLTERSDRPAGLADLKGKVWVADFIYTTCTDTCSLQSARMAALQAEFAPEPDFRLASISVDPAHDTAAVLRQYADRFRADPERWLFLTGPEPAIHALVRDGFKLDVEDVRKGMESRPAAPARGKAGKPSAATDCGLRNAACGMTGRVETARRPDRLLWTLLAPAAAFAHSDHADGPVIHSSRFVLVDRRGGIRGYYLSDDDEAQARLRRDIRILLRDPSA